MNLAKDRAIGASILAAVIVLAAVYFGLIFLGFGFEVLLIVVSIGLLIVLGIGGWIGWTMAITPAPKPIEGIEELKSEELEEAPEVELKSEEIVDKLTSIPGVSEDRARALIDAGFYDAESFRSASPEELTEVKGIGSKLAEEIKKMFAL